MGNNGSAVFQEANNVRYPGGIPSYPSSEALDMPPRRQYGKKKAGGSAAAAKIFGSTAVVENELATEPQTTSTRSALADVTLAVGNLKIDSYDVTAISKHVAGKPRSKDKEIEDNTHESQVAESSPNLATTHHSSRYLQKGISVKDQDLSSLGASNQTTESSSSDDNQEEIYNIDIQSSVTDWIDSSALNTTEDYVDFAKDDPLYLELKPIMDAYRADCGSKMDVITWEDVFTQDSTVRKIAEASFSEVYKVTNKSGASMLKVIRLRTVQDPPSLELSNASTLDALMSEVRIMNTMATVPGFVPFKSAKVVRGLTCDVLTEASEEYFTRKNNESLFQDPDSYTDATVCLVIELAYAGNVLDEVVIETASQVWDVLLGVIIALARGEIASQFEHRDLHENNVCIAHKEPALAALFPEEPVKFGRSGLHPTLIDYGLSRATLATGEVVFFDFEGDKAIFGGLPENQPQFKAYRTMRSHLLTGQRATKASGWHKASKNDNPLRPWSEHIPYTNVVWINYLLIRLREQYQLHGPKGKFKSVFRDQKRELNREVEELARMLSDRGEGFESATQVLEFVVAKGWVTETQLEDFDSSF